MKQLLLVFIGGGIGSVLRFLIGKWANNPETGMPYGTFLANVIGSFLIGLVLGMVAKHDTLSQQHTLLIATGFCGGFTTFSSFAYENQLFFKSGDFMHFAIYTLASLVFGFLAVFAGMYVVKFT